MVVLFDYRCWFVVVICLVYLDIGDVVCVVGLIFCEGCECWVDGVVVGWLCMVDDFLGFWWV